MNPTKTPKTPDPASVSTNTENVDHTRRKIASAGLGGSAVLITLASRPVLGAATCLTPSAAGSGNHSQHNPITCAPWDPATWLSKTPKKSNGNVDTGAFWPDQSIYTPGTLFHSVFTASTQFEYNYLLGQTLTSYTLYEVLSGRKINNGGEDQGALDSSTFTDPNSIGPWFVAGLLNAAANKYGGVIQAIGPDPSVRGIEDEYAQKGFFEPTAGKKWYYDTIIAYLKDPGSVF